MKKLLSKVERYWDYAKRLSVIIAGWLVLNLFRRDLLKKDIWLVCEKRTEARDNGYHFYKYIRQNHPQIHAYYVITKDSADLEKVESLGNVIYADTFRNVLYYLAAIRSVSSQPYGAYPFGFSLTELKLVNKFCNPRQKTVHLRHGIQKDNLPHAGFDYDKCNIDYIVCAVQREYEFVKERHGYPDHAIGCVGFCRFDNLHAAADMKEKMILVMPTWRKWLARQKKGVPLTQSEIDTFQASDFYKQFAALMSDSRLLEAMREHGYKLYFYVHYQLQDFTELFREFANDVVVIADRFHYDVQDLMMRAGIMVTDFSSVQFDFAYMNKPLIYFQFDKDRFVSGHYEKGYYDYEEDGFGPCCYEAQEVCRNLEEMVSGDGLPSELYQRRSSAFFNLRDNKNCQRTFEAVRDL